MVGLAAAKKLFKNQVPNLNFDTIKDLFKYKVNEIEPVMSGYYVIHETTVDSASSRVRALINRDTPLILILSINVNFKSEY
jgi:hypothetical protein